MFPTSRLSPHYWCVALPMCLLLGIALLAATACGAQSTTSTPAAVVATSTLPPPTAEAAACLAHQTPAAVAGGTANQYPTTPSLGGAVFPPNSLTTWLEEGASDGVKQSYSFTIWGVCTAAAAPTDIRTFFSAQMPAHGWTQSATFPYQGDPMRTCGDAYCWSRRISPKTTDYISLESVRAADTVTLYTVREVSFSYNQ